MVNVKDQELATMPLVIANIGHRLGGRLRAAASMVANDADHAFDTMCNEGPRSAANGRGGTSES